MNVYYIAEFPDKVMELKQLVDFVKCFTNSDEKICIYCPDDTNVLYIYENTENDFLHEILPKLKTIIPSIKFYTNESQLLKDCNS